MRGNDLETHVRISFEDSLKGVQVRVPVEVETACSVCHGTGAEPGHRADHVPAVRRPRRRLRLAGPLRVLAAVPALPRERHDRREARASTAAEAGASASTKRYCREDPGRSEERHAQFA